MVATAEHDGTQTHSVRSLRALPEGPVERLCSFVCMAALIVMLGVIGVDIITRALLNFSFEVSDELGGYMLVVIAFVSLPVCQANDSFHHVEFVQSRLSARGRAISDVIFDLLSLAFCTALLWQLVRSEMSSWRFNRAWSWWSVR
jgi:TRAP-type transport system small permease protein